MRSHEHLGQTLQNASGPTENVGDISLAPRDSPHKMNTFTPENVNEVHCAGGSSHKSQVELDEILNLIQPKPTGMPTKRR